MTEPDGLTRNQTLVLAALADAEAPLGAYAILDRLRDDGFRAPPQVYRALDKLIDAGLVHRVECLNAFVACAHPAAPHGETIALAICETCGHVTEFADAAVAEAVDGWCEAKGFVPRSTTVEIRGCCAGCAGKGSCHS